MSRHSRLCFTDTEVSIGPRPDAHTVHMTRAGQAKAWIEGVTHDLSAEVMSPASLIQQGMGAGALEQVRRTLLEALPGESPSQTLRRPAVTADA